MNLRAQVILKDYISLYPWGFGFALLYMLTLDPFPHGSNMSEHFQLRIILYTNLVAKASTIKVLGLALILTQPWNKHCPQVWGLNSLELKHMLYSWRKMRHQTWRIETQMKLGSVKRNQMNEWTRKNFSGHSCSAAPHPWKSHDAKTQGMTEKFNQLFCSCIVRIPNFLTLLLTSPQPNSCFTACHFKIPLWYQFSFQLRLIAIKTNTTYFKQTATKKLEILKINPFFPPKVWGISLKPMDKGNFECQLSRIQLHFHHGNTGVSKCPSFSIFQVTAQDSISRKKCFICLVWAM